MSFEGMAAEALHNEIRMMLSAVDHILKTDGIMGAPADILRARASHLKDALDVWQGRA